ncbi:MAG: NUDIX hydrolase, partial [Brevinematia bacterium]
QDKFVLIKQFRYPVRDYIYEVPAGKLERGEDILEGAIRELREETGYNARYAKKIFEYYPAVGYSSEVIHIVFAKDLEETAKELDEDEFTDVEIIDYNRIIDMIKGNKIKDAKTIISFLLIDKFGGMYEI